jgi:hypothetical protein
VSHLTDAGEGIQIIREKASQLAWPTCTLLTKATLGNPQDNSARYTFAVQNKNKARVLSIVRLAIPWLRDLQLLQMGGTTHLCGEITEDVFVPVSLLGDGALTLASVGLSIIQCRNGAVLLDEFDTAIHYTRLKTVWAEIAGLANEFNCQVFAATHSRECIAAAAAGLSDAQLADDLQYIRLDRLDDGGTVCTAYSSHELNNALEEDWEVR